MAQVSYTSIPFKIEAHQGLSQADGIAKFSSAGIILEFEMKFLTLFGTGVKESRISLEDILDIKFKKGFFKRGAKIEIRMNTFMKLSEVPNTDGKIILKIPRDHHERAGEAVESVLRHMDELRESLNPPRTPVRSLFEPENAEAEQLKTTELDTDKLD